MGICRYGKMMLENRIWIDKDMIATIMSKAFLFFRHISPTEKAGAFLNGGLVQFGIGGTNPHRIVLKSDYKVS